MVKSLGSIWLCHQNKKPKNSKPRTASIALEIITDQFRWRNYPFAPVDQCPGQFRHTIAGFTNQLLQGSPRVRSVTRGTETCRDYGQCAMYLSYSVTDSGGRSNQVYT
jgi:hypothetical protein